jgi:phytoene dehydrogenase-like protein
VRRLVAKYESLGGRLQVNAKVKKVLIENGAAKGIELENGEKHYSNIVVSAADGRSTVMNMLGEDKLDDRMKKLYHNPANEPKSSTIYVSLGVNRTFTETAKPYVMFKVAKPKTIDGREVKYIGVTIHNFDPKCAPAGKTVLTVLLSSFDPKYWIKLRSSDLNRYMAEKQAIADWVVEEVDRHFGNIKSSLEVLDVATPATYVRFTGNWNGAIMGWTEWKFMSTRKPKKTIAGIDNFYMCGQWTGDAGLPGAAQGGREVARMICQQEGKKFSEYH